MPPKLYLDENLSPRLAVQLRMHGFDVVASQEVQRNGLPDDEQLAYAASQERVLVTVNHKDFAVLHSQYFAAGHSHAGILLTTEETTQTLRHRLLRLLNTLNAEDLANQLRWLNEFR
jgi:predicted nuclease of predicted toxin-antitoxin system